MAAMISNSDAWMELVEAEELKGMLIMFGTAVDSLNAASSGSTPLRRSRSHAPGLIVSSCVSR